MPDRAKERAFHAALRRFARVLTKNREEFANRLFLDSGSRTVSSELFVQSFVDRLDDAAGGHGEESFEIWLQQALSAANSLRPAQWIADALYPVLQTIASENDFAVAASEFLPRLARIVHAAYQSDALLHVSHQPLDEVDAAINALLNDLERKDPLTAEHSRAVGSWCARIARALRVSEEETVKVLRCGLLHDIGKLVVSGPVLRAPRPLSVDEWVVVRSHAEAGDRIARLNPLLAPYSDAIRHHHERLDGSGYPDGLSGEQISFEARIVAVADAFSAMIGRAPYGTPMLPLRALDELDAHADRWYDAGIVRALRSVVSA